MNRMFRNLIPAPVGRNGRDDPRWRPGSRIAAGAILRPRELSTVDSGRVRIPDPRRIVHLQFRRFAGCPVCRLHLRSIAQRHAELAAAGILELAVFHSSIEVMRKYSDDLPFAIVADPGKLLYAEFGVEASVRSVLDPRAWRAIARGLATFGTGLEPGESATGLPADFMIAPDGRVLACRYGEHADDHWSVDEVLALAAAARPSGASPAGEGR